MPVLLSRSFERYAAPSLPGGAALTGFRAEPYKDMSRNGPEQPIHELLANLIHSAQNHDNETYFKQISDGGLGHQVDRHIVFKALDFAQEYRFFPVAINIYLESALSHDFIENVLDYMTHHNIDPRNVVLEILEHDVPSNDHDFSAMTKGRQAGIRYAIDDYDPRKRITVDGVVREDTLDILVANGCSFVKLDKNVLWAYKAGRYPELPNILNDIRERYPQLKIIAEGVSLRYLINNQHLAFDASQNSGWGDLEPNHP